MGNGVDFQVSNKDGSIFFDTMEVREEGLCRNPIGNNECDIDIGSYPSSNNNVDEITFELVEKGTQWQLRFPDGDTYNPEKFDSLLEGKLICDGMYQEEIDIFNKNYEENSGHRIRNMHHKNSLGDKASMKSSFNGTGTEDYDYNAHWQQTSSHSNLKYPLDAGEEEEEEEEYIDI